MVAKIKKIRKKEDSREVFFPTLIGILAVLIIGFLVFSNLRINQKRAELTERINSLKNEIQTLEGKKQQLQAGIIQTESEVYWEEKVREQGYKKEGEEAVVVLPPEEAEEDLVEEEKNFFEKILEKLGF